MGTHWAYGNVNYDITKTLAGTEIGHNGPFPAVSLRLVLSDYVPSKRVKPKGIELMFNPGAYAKFRMTQRFGQTASISKTMYNEKFIERGSASFYPYDLLTELYPPEPPDRLNHALAKLQSDVANFGTMLGEYKRTAQMFENIGTRLLLAYQKARHGFILEALKHLGQAVAPSTRGKRRYYRKYGGKRYEAVDGETSLANAWFQYHFGVEQLVKDLLRTCKELEDSIKSPKPLLIRANSTSQTSINKDVTINGRPAHYYAKWRKTFSVIGEIGSIEIRELADHGLTNVPALVWELTPHSWVVDYVVNIGEWLQALDVPRSFKRLSAYESSTKWGTGYALPSAAPNYESWIVPPRAEVNYKATSRSVRVPSAVPPRWNPSLSATKLTNLIALAKQQQGKMR